MLHLPIVTPDTGSHSHAHKLSQWHNHIARQRFSQTQHSYKITRSQTQRHKPILDPQAHCQAWASEHAWPCLEVSPLASLSSQIHTLRVPSTPLSPHGAVPCSPAWSQTVSMASWLKGMGMSALFSIYCKQSFIIWAMSYQNLEHFQWNCIIVSLLTLDSSPCFVICRCPFGYLINLLSCLAGERKPNTFASRIPL